MSLFRQTKLLLLFSLLAAGWSIYQLVSAAAHGQVFSGPYSNIRWITYAEEPFWFVSAIVVYSLLLLMVSAYTFSVLRRGDR